MGLDPGYRTGVKVAVATRTGQVAATATIYPHEPQRRWEESIAQLARLAGEHRVELIAIGNGTASRETDRLGAELIRRHPELELARWWFQRLAPRSTPLRLLPRRSCRG
jgi:uncharacterized protein